MALPTVARSNRGRPPKPTERKRLEGNPGHRTLPKNEPQYPNGVPSKPKRMSAAAARVWDELVLEMSASGVLKRTDHRALWQLCEDEAALTEAYEGLWQMATKLKAKAKASGRDLPGGAILSLLGSPSGQTLMRSLRDLAQRLILERREFGLTPSARARIVVTDAERPCDPLDDAIFHQPAKLLVLPPKP
jgi:P27 family predicted phage terminase small subunit